MKKKGKAQDNTRDNLVKIVALSVLTKIVVFVVTVWGFHSFIDTFDLVFYLQNGANVVNGQLPYVQFPFDYPVLVFIPILIAMVPAVLFQNSIWFFLSFPLLMILCDIGTAVCVYYIGLKIWDSERSALLAACIYTTAFSVAYFVITKYDAFPTFLLVLAVTFTLYGEQVKGYSSALVGFFTKVFPAAALPFFVLYNTTPPANLVREIKNVVLIGTAMATALFLPLVLVNPTPAILRPYLLSTGSDMGVYANSATYAVYQILNQLININLLTILMALAMVVIMIYLIAGMWKMDKKKPMVLIKVLLVALFSLVFFTKFHSPQYIVWLSPFLALLAVKQLDLIYIFYVVQVMAYMEFPLLFGVVYTNAEYIIPGVALVFFTIEYTILACFVYALVKGGEQ